MKLTFTKKIALITAAWMLAGTCGNAVIAADAAASSKAAMQNNSSRRSCCVSYTSADAFAHGLPDPGSAAGAGAAADAYTPALPDSDTLFAGYVKQVFQTGSDENAAAAKSSRKSGSAAVKSFYAGSRLSGQNKIMYYAMKSEIKKIAAGQRSSTIISVPATDLLGRLEFTASELGLSGTFDESQYKAAVSRQFQISMNVLFNALIADCPYELYWYRKSEPALLFLPDFQTNAQSVVFSEDAAVSIHLPVDRAYAGSASFTTDTAKTSAAADAASNAESIVAAAAGKSDHEKLDYYREQILSLVSYDNTASDSSDSRGPWQLIYVFDHDPSTNVVCEGYAKAFQYLCDKTAFSNPHIRSCLVHGSISLNGVSGSHMWNLVHTGQGGCYLADITNCDAGSIGADDKLFLTGCSSGNPQDGYTVMIPVEIPSPDTGAPVRLDAAVTYTYDPDVKNIFSADDLTLTQGGQLREGQLTEPAKTPHTYHASFLWSGHYRSCTAQLICQSDPAHVTAIDCTVTSETAKPASCCAKGTTAYTAQAVYEGNTYEETKEIEDIAINPAAHTGNTLIRGQKPATSTEAGYTGDIYCSDCGAKTTEGTAIPPAASSSGITKKTVQTDDGATVSVTVRTDKTGAVTGASAAITKTIRNEKTAVLSADTVSKIIEAAGQKSVSVTMTMKTASGAAYKLKLNTKDLTAKNPLYLYETAADGSYLMVNAKTYTVSPSGDISISLADLKQKTGCTCQLITRSKAAKISRSVKNSIAIKRPAAVLKKGGTAAAKLDSRFQTANAQRITYTSSAPAVAAVSKTGKITAKKSGSAVIKVRVQLKNGMAKTVSMKIKVK